MANNSFNTTSTCEDDFYFESDHLALKGNKDYCDVLKTIVILTAQQKKAIEDFNKVVEMRKRALEDPFRTLEEIRNGEDLGLPPIAELPKIPNINFRKYDVRVPEDELKAIYSDSLSTKSDENNINVEQSVSNNRSWSPEEQKKLEELLVIYPPEPVEMRRFHKIAKALGNRTVQQVCSRVQKYFLKLYKAGLPVPGRIPKSSEKYKKSLVHKHQRHNHYLWKPTTFFPDLYVPVTMNDLDNIPGPSSNSSSPSSLTSSSSNYLMPTEVQSFNNETVKNESEQQLDLLKRVKIEKINEMNEGTNLFQHFGYRCDYCDVNPITGSRWHCMTCTDSVDFCTDCVISQMYSDNAHPSCHYLTIISNETENSKSPSTDLHSFTSKPKSTQESTLTS